MNSITNMSTKVSFEKTGLPIPEYILSLPYDKQLEICDYLCKMDVSQKKAYLIAQEHLGTSFNILKSNGFKNYISK